MKNHDLRVFDIKKNKTNGGSMRYLICHLNSKFKTNKKKINFILNQENIIRLGNRETFIKFKKKIDNTKLKTKLLLNKIIEKNNIVHGYGASTKGNVLLQYFNINKNLISVIAEKNKQKFNNYTPGTKIKIISEQLSRKIKPDYYFVLPWHFKNEILDREKKIRKKGTKFIFPLPKLEVI